MLRHLQDMIRSKMQGKNGDIGTLHDVLFDDKSWAVRYLLVQTGTWLTGSQVMLSPKTLERADWDSGAVDLNLTREDLRNNLKVGSERPISQQSLEATQRGSNCRDYPSAMGAGYGVFSFGPPALLCSPVGTESEERSEAYGKKSSPHLRSARETVGYSIHSEEGILGYVDDFLVEEKDWKLRYVVVDTGVWWPGKRVLVATAWIGAEWGDSRMHTRLDRGKVRSAPEYERGKPLTEEYEKMLYKHYGRRHRSAPRAKAA